MGSSFILSAKVASFIRFFLPTKSPLLSGTLAQYKAGSQKTKTS